MPELRLFYDLISQPCRAVVMFLDANKIPYESVVIKLTEGMIIKSLFIPPGWFIMRYRGNHFPSLRFGDFMYMHFYTEKSSVTGHAYLISQRLIRDY